MYEGYHVLFQISLALLKIHEDELLAARDEGAAFMLLREIPKRAFDVEKILKVRFGVLGLLCRTSIELIVRWCVCACVSVGCILFCSASIILQD